MARRLWNALPGVDPGTWDYLNSSWIAERYESYFDKHPLFDVDQTILRDAFGPPNPQTRIIDFGCGNGRALLPLVAQGFSGLGVDLSVAMLREVQRKARDLSLEVGCIRANLVQLDGIRDHSCDHGMCLFSTLGMIHGRSNRVQALRHFRRIIKPEGCLILHVHNYWYNLWDPGGPWWLLKNLGQARWSQWFGNRQIERGDKHYPYRGLTNMFLHVFTRREMQADLTSAGWENATFLPLRPVTMEVWPEPAFAKSIRNVGWIIRCQ